jgi:hypothetical protein
MSTIMEDARASVRDEVRWAAVRQACQENPKALIAHMKGFDPTQQEHFGFEMSDPRAPWGWQSLVIDWWMGQLTPEGELLLREFMNWWDGDIDPKLRKFIILKARQLGVTWLAVALGLWFILYRPGSNVVAWSQGLDEAKLLIQRAWLMYQALPFELRSHATVLSPQRAEIPSEQIILQFADGKISTFVALPDTKKAGQSRTITLGIMDELARMDYARGIYNSVNPAVARGGRLIGVSTAEGSANAETGEGNFFAYLWSRRKSLRLSPMFLPWNLHPERDDEWYATEAMALPSVERNRSYPLTPEDAFILSGDLYFEPEALSFYRSNTRRSLYRGQFQIRDHGKAEFVKIGGGIIEVWVAPRPGGKYAISADTSTGRSADYSAAHVIDLSSGDIVAEMRGKMDYPTFSAQLKCMGRWYADERGIGAKIIPERTGVGEALIALLRSDGDGLKPYGNIYQHVRKSDVAQPQSGTYGFPMQAGTRALVLENLRSWIYKRKFAFLSPQTVEELSTFIYRETGTSPRAMEGCNDDMVMSLALAVFLMEDRGETPQQPLRKKVWAKVQAYLPPTTMSKEWQPKAAQDEYGPNGRYAPIVDERNPDGSRT